MPRTTVAIMLVVFLGGSTACMADSLSAIEDQVLSRLVSGIEIAREERTPDFLFRALRLRELGECDGSPATCPKEQFYLAVSTLDEAPDQAVYELPVSHKWEITKLARIDSPGEFQRFIVLTMRREVPSEDPSDHWWDVETYQVRLNPWAATIALEAPSVPKTQPTP